MRSKRKRQYNKKAEFYDEKFDTLVKWAKDKEIELPWSGSTEEKKEKFIETYLDYRRKGSKNPLKSMQYNLQYTTDYKTVMAERAWLKEHNKELIPLKELKNMSTQDFYKKFKDDIEAYRKDIKSENEKKSEDEKINSYKINKMISNYFFGSN